MVSIQDILQIPDFDLKLLAGAAATDTPVRWVLVADMPRTLESLKGGELLLTTGRLFEDCVERPAECVAEVIDLDVAGLGFCTGQLFDHVPAALVTAADAAGLPLFEVPRHISPSGLVEVVTTKIVNAQYSLLQRSMAVHEKLTTLMLEEQGIDAITATLANLVRCSCTLFAFHGEVLSQASAGSRGTLEAEGLWGLIVDRRLNRAAFGVSLQPGENAQVFPVMVAHRIGGFLVVVKDSGVFSEYDRLILHHVVTATALEMVKRRAVAQTKQRLVGDLLDQLVARHLSEDEMARRLAFFGFDPRAAHLIMIADWDDAPRAADGAGGDQTAGDDTVSQQLHWAVDECMAERQQHCLTTLRNGRVVLLLEIERADGDAMAELGEALLAAVSSMLPDMSVSVGIGRSHGNVADLRRSYYEAQYAIRIRRLRGDRGVVADHRDLGSYSLLLGLQDAPSLEVFCDSVLGRLREHDERNSSDLVASLASFLEANGHWGDAAERLFVHRHTLRYRMKRVQEITGRDLDEPQDRMEFWLALRAKEFIEGVDDQTP